MLDFVFDKHLSEFAYVNELPGDDFLTQPAEILPIAQANYKGVSSMMLFSLQNSEKGPAFITPAAAFTKKIPSAAAAQVVHSAPALTTGAFCSQPTNAANGMAPHKRHTLIGIKNRGNSCYVNSVLQCFGAMARLNESLEAASRVERPFLSAFRKVNRVFWAPVMGSKEHREASEFFCVLVLIHVCCVNE